MKQTILVTGANGQLGSELQAIANQYEYDVLFTDAATLDITSLEQVQTFVTGKNINYIINCAAYTQVDQAENEPELAAKVNDLAVANLVQVAQDHNIKLVHVSTDYVFDGTSHQPLKETDPTNPIGVYGRTKRAGELHIINAPLDYIIIRTSWLYSNFQANFVKTIERLASERESLTIIADQVGTPTYAADLAQAIWHILPQINSQNSGVYHFSNEGVASWYDFAQEIVSLSHLNCVILPIETKDYKTLAARPYYSVMNKKKIKEVFNINIDYWKNALVRCVKARG
jgi:dTDP-4-dehydrorhamnose reductase